MENKDVIFYDPREHRKMLEYWLTQWKLPIPPPEMFPKLGLIVDGCVMGFLLETNSAQCFIDQVVGDRDESHSRRSSATKRLVAMLEIAAHERGYTLVSALGGPSVARSHLVERGFSPMAEFGLYCKRLR